MGCLSSCKDTNFKANHNVIFLWKFNGGDVYPLAKIRILKQITTIFFFFFAIIMMFILLQRYEF